MGAIRHVGRQFVSIFLKRFELEKLPKLFVSCNYKRMFLAFFLPGSFWTAISIPVSIGSRVHEKCLKVHD